MLKKFALFSVCAVALMSSDIKIYGGIEEYKDDGEKERIKSLDLSGNFYSYGGGGVGKVELGYDKYKDSDLKHIVTIGAMAGYQLGSPKGPDGALRILPIGVEIQKHKFVGDYVDAEGRMLSFKDGSLVYYKGAIEFQKDNLIDNLYVILNAGYKVVLNSYEISYNQHKFELKPKGYEFSTELGYAFSDVFLLGVKAGYKSVYDKLYGEKIYVQKGGEYKLSLGYRF